jgi:hypothetical protein
MGRFGGARPRAIVETVTVAVPLPEAKVFGLIAQIVEVAATGREQDKFTWAEKPFRAETVMPFVNVAVWPAFTVWVVAPEEKTEKSGGAVTVSVKVAEEAL